MKYEYRKAVYQRCDSELYDANLTNWFPRACCFDHAKHDKRTPGLFKVSMLLLLFDFVRVNFLCL